MQIKNYQDFLEAKKILRKEFLDEYKKNSFSNDKATSRYMKREISKIFSGENESVIKEENLNKQFPKYAERENLELAIRVAKGSIDYWEATIKSSKKWSSKEWITRFEKELAKRKEEYKLLMSIPQVQI